MLGKTSISTCREQFLWRREQFHSNLQDDGSYSLYETMIIDWTKIYKYYYQLFMAWSWYKEKYLHGTNLQANKILGFVNKNIWSW